MVKLENADAIHFYYHKILNDKISVSLGKKEKNKK